MQASMSLGDMLERSLELVFQVLKNDPQRVKRARHDDFLFREAENIAFLVSRVISVLPQMKKHLARVMGYIVGTGIFDHAETGIWIALNELGDETPTPVVKGYPLEFPSKVLRDRNFVKVTSIFVAQALAVWSFYDKNITKLAQVVDVGLQRCFATHNKALAFSRRALALPREFFVYFVTHIVLVATMWGELREPAGGDPAKWLVIEKLLEAWASSLASRKAENLEVWLEVLFCLDLLHRSDIVELYAAETLALFLPNSTTKNQHRAYHTYVLWAFFLTRYKHILNSQPPTVVVAPRFPESAKRPRNSLPHDATTQKSNVPVITITDDEEAEEDNDSIESRSSCSTDYSNDSADDDFKLE